MRIDNGSSRDGPLDLDIFRELHQEFCLLALVAANGVGLIQDDAIPALVHHLISIEDGVIVGDVYIGAFYLFVLIELDPALAVLDEDAKAGLQGIVGPVVDKGERTQDEGLHLAIVLADGEDLYGLAEAHIIALEAAIDGSFGVLLVEFLIGGSLLFELEHLVDAGALVGKVGEAGPQRADGAAPRAAHRCDRHTTFQRTGHFANLDSWNGRGNRSKGLRPTSIFSSGHFQYL